MILFGGTLLNFLSQNLTVRIILEMPIKCHHCKEDITEDEISSGRTSTVNVSHLGYEFQEHVCPVCTELERRINESNPNRLNGKRPNGSKRSPS